MKMIRTIQLLIALLAFEGCLEPFDEHNPLDPEHDMDGDGYTEDEGDCDDANADLSPGVVEACDGLDNDCDGVVGDEEFDQDGDGFVPCDTWIGEDPDIHGDGDCDDEDPTTFPLVDESCDGLDNDCDGVVPEDEEDADGDGQRVCGGDCDDHNMSVYAGANENCDATLDNDCDGVTDSNESDDDGDGWTDCQGDCDDSDEMVSLADNDGDGYSACDGDCDDGDTSINPDAIDVCNDGIDNNCDGSHNGCMLEGLYDLEFPDAKILGTAAEDLLTYPRALSAAGDLDQDGLDDFLIGSMYNVQGGELAGAVYVWSGPVSGEYTATEGTATIIGDSGATAGYAISAGDADGDGSSDVLISAPWHEVGDEDSGVVYLFSGPVLGQLALADADARMIGEAELDYAGMDVSLSGDVNGDGLCDALIGAEYANANGLNSGSVYLVEGPISGTVDLTNADTEFEGLAQEDYTGYAVDHAGDVDGDGHGDLLIGAPGDNTGGIDAGMVYLVYGPPPAGDVEISVADASFRGESADDLAGFSLSRAGDVDADGFDDILIGAPGDDSNGDNAGKVYLFHGPVNGPTALNSADAGFIGEYAGNGVAWEGTVTAAGDVNGDGFDDVVVGAIGNTTMGTFQGAAYLLYGPLSGTTDLADADAKFKGELAYDYAGRVSAAGDVNGDGYSDFLVGADMGGTGRAGAAYLIYGGGI